MRVCDMNKCDEIGAFENKFGTYCFDCKFLVKGYYKGEIYKEKRIGTDKIGNSYIYLKERRQRT